MSTPVNPLSKYRSYAYQQLLLVCDTTETAEAVSADNQYLAFSRTQDADRTNTPDSPYAKYQPYKINLSHGRTGKYVILINGMEDAEFIISKAHWYNTVAADAGGAGNNYSTLNSGGELEINEPQGIRFMNVLGEVADSLGSNPSALIFMLKTVFVGYPSPTFETDGFPEPITNIRPLMFWISNITGSFSITGGDYKVEFAGINHGLTKQPHILKSADRIKIDIASSEDGCEANTLAGALCKLQSNIDTIYTTYYNKMKTTIENTKTPDGKNLVFNGRKVTYVITAEHPLDGSEYLVTDFKDSATNTAETGKAGMIELSSEPSVEAAILAIAKRCPKIQEDLINGDGSDEQRTRYVPKVATTIRSTDTEYQIIYHLRRVVESREDILKIITNRVTDDTDTLGSAIRKNILELDYMYTGKNTDVIDFDLKLEYGLTLFHNLATTDNIPTSGDSADGTSRKTETATQKPYDVAETFNGRIRPQTPIFLSTKVDVESIKHSTNAKRAVDFQELMNRHAAIENAEAVVKIHGNPGLLNTVNKPPSEISETAKSTDPVVGTGDDENQEALPYWETIPALIKLNIKMPSVYYGGAVNSGDFGEDFWYRGLYYCYAIEQLFDGGEFTQQIHMVSLPKNSPEENTQKDVTQTEQTDQTKAANQASNTAGSGTSTGEIPIVGNTNMITIVINTTAGETLDAHSGN